MKLMEIYFLSSELTVDGPLLARKMSNYANRLPEDRGFPFFILKTQGGVKQLLGRDHEKIVIFAR